MTIHSLLCSSFRFPILLNQFTLPNPHRVWILLGNIFFANTKEMDTTDTPLLSTSFVDVDEMLGAIGAILQPEGNKQTR